MDGYLVDICDAFETPIFPTLRIILIEHATHVWGIILSFCLTPHNNPYDESHV
jgi:hypothetical protein